MIHGHGDDYQGELVANFSSNVWHGADNEPLYEHLSSVMHRTARYPESDAFSLKKLIAEKENISPNQLGIYNGSTEAFYHIAQTFNGCKSLIVSPTFSEYADACQLHLHEIIFTKKEEMLEAIATIQPDLVWLCNPNNPDGHYFLKRELLEMIDLFPKTIFVIDQAYCDFTLHNPIEATKINQHHNLILVHSLTKRYLMPGLRLGYVVSSSALLHRIEKFRIPWSINTMAIEAGIFILTNNQEKLPIAQWLKEAEGLRKSISELANFEAMHSNTPFFLVKIGEGKAADLKRYLLEEMILVRDATNFVGLTGELIRINTLTKAKNELLIQKLDQWIPKFTSSLL